MNAVPSKEAMTAEAFLFDDTDLVSALQASGIDDMVRGEVEGFGQHTRDELIQEVGKLGGELLHLDVTQLLLDAWSKLAELRAAGERTVAATESEEVVDLLSHRVTLEDRPSIELLVNGSRIGELRFLLLLEIDVEALAATVRRGRLIGLRVGRCDLRASLTIEDKPIASRRAQFELPVSVRLGSGIALVDVAPRVPSTSEGCPPGIVMSRSPARTHLTDRRDSAEPL